MATLTGTTIQSTYDSLLKVTDNDSITGSLKRITDGLGNNTPLYLSSSAVEIVSTLNVTSTITGSNLSGTNTGDETKASIETKLGAATSSNSGYLTSADWSTFSNKIAGSGTLNTIPKFSSSSSIGNSIIYDTGTAIGIGTISPSATLDVYRASGETTFQISAGAEYARLFYRDTDDNFGVFINGVTRFRLIGSTGNGALLESGTGNLAIGTTAATATTKLWVNGTGYFSGNLGIGSAVLAQYNLRLEKSITGNATSFSFYNAGTVQSDVTTTANYNATYTNTAAAAFTLTGMNHYNAIQGVFGAGSVVTNQAGFRVDSSLIGATNNYGFRGLIPAGTGRWNLYLDGTANNYMAGGLGIGATFLTAHNLRVDRNITGGAVSHGIYNGGIVQSDVTTQARYYTSAASTQATTFTCADLRHYLATQGTFGAGSTVSIQMGYMVDSTLIGATNNYGFRGQIPSGTGRWNIYMDGTASNYLNGTILIGSTFDIASNYKVQVTGDIYTSGSIAIGSVSSISTKLLGIGRAITGATTAYGITFEGNIESTVTTNGIVYRSYPIVTGGTLGTITHYIASKNAFIGGSTVTNQYGFFADASVSGATNNYGFYGNIASATGAWNLYMNGTAQNYINGNLGIGVAVPTVKLDVSGAGLFSSSVTASSFIKSGGTSAQLLAGDGSVVTAGTNITISGGTISSSGGLSGSGTTNYVAKFTGSSAIGNSLIFDNGTNVGIGTTSPSAAKLVLNSGTTNQNALINGDKIGFTRTSDAAEVVYFKKDISLGAEGTANINGYDGIQFRTQGAETVKAVITSTGNVGIGTSSPATLLDVRGSNGVIANFVGSSGKYGQIYSDANAAVFGASNSTSLGNNYLYINPSSSFQAFVTNGGESMRITSGGNVGIGTSSPGVKLDVIGALNVTSDSTEQIVIKTLTNTNRQLLIGYNYTPNYSYIQAVEQGVAYRNLILQQNGGNVGIGTTSPAYKLDVVGGINYQNQFNRQTASYTLVLADASKIVETNVGSANNLTVPLNSSVAFPTGTEIAVLQYGSGQTTIVATSGVTLRSKSNALKISGQFAGCTLVKVGTDEWYVVGDLTI